ncbi:Bug family tripartite tricarboxylate transporter substrate binding protein [Roseomonas xinghualingensis]|uniref:Bug family tripartite tricarboxylate transporter substrate binding protein n=1 Tax=Roseomonas xinghualingensis TaxID=2986475 RepID=UPI0021F109F5|nr:tripartite tricarboxylate transporter substrate binding protein [Roseomonas sp. SXEYE001]MCV4207917.1 tripartite tricarboxylate transporter substrate binding protein [Roseomonas sp. SXEYE001]
MLRRRSLMAGLAALPALAAPTLAQPLAGGRPLRVVVPFPPGGAIDLLGRLVAERLGPALGQGVVVENRGGAGGILGTDAVAKGPNDGSMIGVIGGATMTAYPFLYSKLPFDPVKDLTPLSLINTGALICVVNAEVAAQKGWTDFRKLVAYSKAHPDQVKMGSSGPGTSSHLCIEAVNAMAGARFLHVPYRGGAPAITDLLAGTIDMMFDVTPALVPHVQSGKFKALTLSSKARMDFMPDLPAMGDFADLGLGDLDISPWNALMAPANTPEPVVKQLFEAIKKVAADPTFVSKLKPLGYDVVVSESPAALAAQVARETPMWRRLVEISGTKLD